MCSVSYEKITENIPSIFKLTITRPQSVMSASSASEQLPELSDVQCYTCRRRHVKCDRILPHCAKCRKKGVQCLGYQKPLRWADGVAVRGKLKGRSQPVIEESKVMKLVQNSVQQKADNALQEAAHYGVKASIDCYNEIAVDPSHIGDIIAYYNSIICSERVTRAETIFVEREIPQITPRHAQLLPKSIFNALLGVAAVHMAARNPSNAALERLALETKVNIFQSHNRLLSMVQNQLDHRVDVVISCGILIFAMDIIEYGMDRWMVHTLGSMHVMSSFGGIESLAFYYPHLHIPLLQVSLFETFWIVVSHVPLTKPKQTSRVALELLVNSHFAKAKVFNSCAATLTFAIWDTAACAQKIFGHGGTIAAAEINKRDKILMSVLSFEPEDGTKEVKREWFGNAPSADTHLRNWNSIGAAWKAATTILVLRHLYFGRPELEPFSNVPSPNTLDFTGLLSSFAPDEHLGAFYQGTEEPNMGGDYLAAGLYFDEPLSQTPSPMPSPRLISGVQPTNMWNSRYDIHNEAFHVLASVLAEFQPFLEPVTIRHVLVPVMILGLVSRPNSRERAICMYYLTKFEEFMATPSLSPVGGAKTELRLPWDKIDAYSGMFEAQSHYGAGYPMAESAPEWNWWDMLKHIDMNMSWPVTIGQSHFERGQEFWAFLLISAVANEECFKVWMEDPNQTSPQSGSFA